MAGKVLLEVSAYAVSMGCIRTSYHILEEGKTKWVFKHASRTVACNKNEDGEVGVEGCPVGEQRGREGGWMPWETGRGLHFVLCRRSPATQSRGNCKYDR